MKMAAFRPLPLLALAILSFFTVLFVLIASTAGGWELIKTALQNGAGNWSVTTIERVLTQRFMLLSPLINSLLLAIPVAILATMIGGFLAWLAERSDFYAGRWLIVLVALPHIIPGFQLASAWVGIFSFGGLWAALAQTTSPFPAYGYGPMLVVLTLHFILFPYLLISASLQAADPAMEEAGRIAGLSARRLFFRITLPLARPALFASLLLVFASVMEEFGIPSLLGTPSGFDTLTTRIYGLATTYPLDLSGASVLALVLGMVALAILWTQLRLLAGVRIESIAGKVSRQSRNALGRWGWPLGFVIWSVMLLLALAPLLTLLVVSLLDSWGHGYGPTNWTFARYSALWESQELRRALLNTLILAMGAAALVTISSVAIVYAMHRLKRSWLGRIAQLADRMSFVAFALPGLVIGVALILAFSGGWLPLYGTTWILLLAFTLRFSGIGIRTISARMMQISVELESAAEVGGLHRLQIMAHIVLPLLGPALISSSVLVFINSVKEISATSLLAAQGSETLAYEAYLRFQEGSYTQGSAISIVMIALVLVFMLAGRLASRKTPTISAI